MKDERGLMSKTALEQSYKTTKRLADKLNNITTGFIRWEEPHGKDEEDYSADGTVMILSKPMKVEYKQRMSTCCIDCLDRKMTFNDSLHYIPMVSTKHGADVYVIYDKTLDACFIYYDDDIDKQHIVMKQFGRLRRKCYTIPADKVQVFDLRNGMMTLYSEHIIPAEQYNELQKELGYPESEKWATFNIERVYHYATGEGLVLFRYNKSRQLWQTALVPWWLAETYKAKPASAILTNQWHCLEDELWLHEWLKQYDDRTILDKLSAEDEPLKIIYPEYLTD